MQYQKYQQISRKYQLDGDNAYSFGQDKQFTYFQSPFQAEQY